MNTLDDLRATLEREAAFDDTERHLRPVAVRQRVRAVRRRRAGAVAMAAAVAVVAATAVAGALRGSPAPEPAGPTLEEVQVPQTIDVYGFTYKLTATQRAADDGTVTLSDPPDGPAAVSLVATGLGSGRATLWSGYYSVARVRGGEQVSPATDSAARSQPRVELEGAPPSARAEVAVYEPTGELAPGISSGGAVFRQRYAGHVLVAAAFGEGGDEARVDVPHSLDGLTTSAYCHSGTTGLWLHGVGDDGALPCATFDTGNDPGPRNEDYPDRPGAGDDTVGVYVTEGKDGPRAAGVDVTFGVALYRETVPPTQVLGAEEPTVLEQHGRTWHLDDVISWDGRDSYEVDTSDGDALVAATTIGTTSEFLSWRGAPEGGWVGYTGNGTVSDSPGAVYGPVLLAGDHTVQLHLEGPHPQGRLLVYRPD